MRRSILILLFANAPFFGGCGVTGGTDGGSTDAGTSADLLACPFTNIPNLIDVPIRLCVMAGSVEAGGVPAGGMTSADNLVKVVQTESDKIWLPQAHISLHNIAPPGGAPA